MVQALASSFRATCPRRRVGCILVSHHGTVLATGYNGVAKSLPHCTEHPCPGANALSGQSLDQCEAIHAEVNALTQCQDIHAVRTAYVTAMPCMSCTKQLLASSCREIVYLSDYPQGEASRALWQKAGGYSRKLDNDKIKGIITFMEVSFLGKIWP